MPHYIVMYNKVEPEGELGYVGPIEAISPQAAVDSMKNENFSYVNVFPIQPDEHGDCEYWTLEELRE